MTNIQLLMCHGQLDVFRELSKIIHRKPFSVCWYSLAGSQSMVTRCADRLQQIVFYQSGVGAGNDFGGADDWADKYELVRGTSTG